MLGNINAAGAALRNWVINLRNELAYTGVQAAHIAISTWIGDGAERAAARGSRLYAVCSRPKIRQLFGLTGLDCRIPLTSTLDEALEALAAAGPHHESRRRLGGSNLTAADGLVCSGGLATAHSSAPSGMVGVPATITSARSHGRCSSRKRSSAAIQSR
jgi:hypothetical protein